MDTRTTSTNIYNADFLETLLKNVNSKLLFNLYSNDCKIITIIKFINDTQIMWFQLFLFTKNKLYTKYLELEN